MKLTLTAIAAAAVLPLLASAHFTLDYPPTRGFDEDIESRALPLSTSSGRFELITRHSRPRRVLRRLLDPLVGPHALPSVGLGARHDWLAPRLGRRRHLPLARQQPDELCRL